MRARFHTHKMLHLQAYIPFPQLSNLRAWRESIEIVLSPQHPCSKRHLSGSLKYSQLAFLLGSHRTVGIEALEGSARIDKVLPSFKIL